MTGDALAQLPLGTAVSVDQHGRHSRRLVGRITAVHDGHLELDTTAMGEVSMTLVSIKRGRAVAALYEPGDPVLLRHVPASTWRGGVVRVDGTDVLVEQIDGTFAWHPEDDLEPAEARESALVPAARG